MIEHGAPERDDGIGFGPEATMFCACGEDREALRQLGVRLAAVLHDPARLAAIIEAIGPTGFDD